MPENSANPNRSPIKRNLLRAGLATGALLLTASGCSLLESGSEFDQKVMEEVKAKPETINGTVYIFPDDGTKPSVKIRESPVYNGIDEDNVIAEVKDKGLKLTHPLIYTVRSGDEWVSVNTDKAEDGIGWVAYSELFRQQGTSNNEFLVTIPDSNKQSKDTRRAFYDDGKFYADRDHQEPVGETQWKTPSELMSDIAASKHEASA